MSNLINVNNHIFRSVRGDLFETKYISSVGKCINCNRSGIELTTHCPSYNYKYKVSDVSQGKIDYRYNKWILGIKSRHLFSDLDNTELILNEKKYLNFKLNQPVLELDVIEDEKLFIYKLCIRYDK